MKQLKQITTVFLVVLAQTTLSSHAQAAPFDQAWIDAMVPHHQMATQMAQVVVKKARYPEVRALARNIIADQNKEINEMRGWRKDWYGSASVPMNGMMHKMPNSQTMRGMGMTAQKTMSPSMMMGLPMKMEMDMGKLSQMKGVQLDKMFLAMMIPHHASAITMADEALKVTARPQIRVLSHAIIDAQAKEIGEMRSIYRRYFGKM